MLVVCDTFAINYLVQIDEIDFIWRLFGRACIPPSVHQELLHPRAPETVRRWTAALPPWMTISDPGPLNDPALLALDQGERQAIAAAELLRADFLLSDDSKVLAAARLRGLPVLTALLILNAATGVGSPSRTRSIVSGARTSASISSARRNCCTSIQSDSETP